MSYRNAFSALTLVLFLVTSWAVYANVFSDNSELVVSARELAQKTACGGKCAPARVRIERGMISQTFDYDFQSAGSVTVTCRRQAIVVGEYSCEATPTK